MCLFDYGHSLKKIFKTYFRKPVNWKVGLKMVCKQMQINVQKSENSDLQTKSGVSKILGFYKYTHLDALRIWTVSYFLHIC